MALGECDEFLEVAIFPFARPKKPDRSRYAQVRNPTLQQVVLRPLLQRDDIVCRRRHREWPCRVPCLESHGH
jgi:hypothetical protein